MRTSKLLKNLANRKGIDEIKAVRRILNFITRNPSELLSIGLFTTNRCNSKCKICGIWKEEPKRDLPLEIIENVFKNKMLKPDYTTIALTGGEFIMHPKCREIISLCEEYGLNYNLLSNAIDSDKLIDIVREFEIRHLYLSLDGHSSTYKIVRGVDGYYNVIKVIEELKDETNITIAYTINPWNNSEDYIHVLEIVKKNNLNLVTVIYDDIKLFNTEFRGKKLFYDVSDLMEDVLNRRFISLYNKWLNGMRIPCLSIRANTFIMPNGDVRLCHCTNVILGNLFEKSFTDIWKSKKTRDILRRFTKCNECYAHCHRMFDLSILEKTKFLPNSVLNMLWGRYDYNLLRRYDKRRNSR